MSELLASQSTEKQRLARMFGSLSHVKKWMALDGPMDSTWLENMGTLLDSTKALNLPNGESISQPGINYIYFNDLFVAIAVIVKLLTIETHLLNLDPSII